MTRNISIELSSEDTQKLIRRCGECGITVNELVENFVSDLINGKKANGSDEVAHANDWFRRCWFGMYPEDSLVSFLVNNGYDVYVDFLEIIDNIECGRAELEGYKKYQSTLDEEEIEFLKTDIEDWQNQIVEIKSDYRRKNANADWDAEVKKVNEWWKATRELCE